MVIVPAFAVGQQCYPPEVRRVVTSFVGAITPDVGGRVDQPGGVKHENCPHESSPDQPAHPTESVETDEQKDWKHDCVSVKKPVNTVLVKIGSPFLVVFGRVPRGEIGRHPPEHVGPGEAAVGAMDVVLEVGVGVVVPVIRHPADRAPSDAQQPMAVKTYSSHRGRVAKLR